MERRRIDVDDHLGARIGLASSRPFRQPNVLTDVDTDDGAFHGDQRQAAAWIEVAALVKDAIIGQVPFRVRRHQPSIGDHCGGVIEFMPSGRKDRRRSLPQARRRPLPYVSNHGDAITTRANHLVQCAAIVCDELRLQEQIFRRIAGHGQFGKRDQVRLGLFGFSQPPDDSSHVAVQIPHGGIHLDHGNAKGTHRF